MSVIAPEPMPGLMFATPQRRKQSTLFTLSGGLTTDGIRQRFGSLDSAIYGDGADPSSMMGCWKAATNLLSNGGFESNTTGWTAHANSTITRVTSVAKFGNASGEMVLSGVAAGEGMYQTFTATAAVYALQVWAKGSGTIRLAVARDSDGGLAQTGSTFTLTSSWQRLVFTTTALTATTWRFIIHTATAQAITFQVDGAQVELGPVRTPYIETDGGTASRTAGRVQMPSTILDETQGWLAFKVRMGFNQTAPPQADMVLFDWRDDSNNRIGVEYTSGSGGQVQLSRLLAGAGAVAQQAYAAGIGGGKTFILAWTATACKVSIDGVAFTSAANSSIPTLAVTTAEIGQAANIGANFEFDGDIFWMAYGAGTLTDGNAATIHALGTVGNQPAVFPGSCKLYWQGLNSKALVAN